MSIFDLVRKMAAPPARKANDVTWDGSRGWQVVTGKDGDDLPDSFEAYVLEALRRNPIVAAAVREIQTSLSEAPIRAYRKDADGEWVLIPNHRAEALLAAPNGKDSGVEFIERLCQHYLLGGNGYVRKVRSGFGIPLQLRTIRPDRVRSVDVDRDGIPVAWEVATKAYGQPERIPASEIVHIPDTDPLNEVFGMPRIAAAALDIATDNEASSYVHELLSNHGSPGTLVLVDAAQVRNRAVLELSEERWEERFGPHRGRGKVAFLPGAHKVESIGFNLSDLEFPDLRRVTREDIAAVFGVDPRLLGISSATGSASMNGNEYEEARRKLWVQTIIPLIRRFEGKLNAALAPDFGENVWLRFDLSEVLALAEDRSAAVERGVKMAESGGATLPEVRAEMGLDPDVDPDALLVHRGSIKLVPATPPEPDDEEDDPDGDQEDDGGGGGDVGADEDDEDGDEEAGWTPDPEFKAETARMVRMLAGRVAEWEQAQTDIPNAKADAGPWGVTPAGGRLLKGADSADRVREWKRFDDLARAQEPIYRMAADRMFDRQRREIDAMLRETLEDGDKAAFATPPETKGGITRESLDRFKRRLGARFDEYHRAWRARFDALLSQTVDVTAGRLSGATGLSFDVRAPLVKEAIRNRVNFIVGADHLTKAAILEQVERGFRDGLGRDEVARMVRRVFDRGLVTKQGRVLSAAERSKLIAQTETTAISNSAAVRLMRSTGADWVKMWLSQGDDRVRDEHRDEESDSHENPVPLKEAFRITGLDAPAEPNCRCTVLFEPAE